MGETMTQHDTEGKCCIQIAAHASALAEKQRLTDLVRHQRHELHAANLISNEEFAALVEDSEGGKRVARLESYDGVRAQLTALQSTAADFEHRWKQQQERADNAEEQVRQLTAGYERHAAERQEWAKDRHELEAQVRGLREAAADFRDRVLNQRHQFEEPCLDNDQTNAVLDGFDETIGAALATAPPQECKHVHPLRKMTNEGWEFWCSECGAVLAAPKGETDGR